MALFGGRVVYGAIKGLDRLPLMVGTQQLTLDLTSAFDVRLDSPLRTDSVHYVMTIRADGKPVQSLNGVILLQAVTGPDSAVPPIKPPTLPVSKSNVWVA